MSDMALDNHTSLGPAIFVEDSRMKIKPITAEPPVTFETLNFPPEDQTLAKEAKKLNNREKGYKADERYLGEQQNLAQKAERYARTGEAPWDDDDFDQPEPWGEL